MSKDENKRWQCTSCDVISLEVDLLRAANPFDAGDIICGCPNCKSVEEFREICDEPGCEREAGCGFPAGEEFGGYRRTCHEHSDWYRNQQRKRLAVPNGEVQRDSGSIIAGGPAGTTGSTTREETCKGE